MTASVLRLLAPALFSCLATLPGRADADTLTIDLPNVRSAQGSVMVALCGDPAVQFPGTCIHYRGMARAAAGSVSVRVEGVPAGRYAVQAFHDENGNLRPDIPPEGYAFGNNQPWPPSFETAAIQVKGDTRSQLSLVYMGAASSQQGSAAAGGVAPPAGVTRIDVRERGLYGALYVPAGGTPAPALLLVGGSEGGVETISRMATSFARAGFATLALAYWGAPGLPASLENIPLEYFDQAIAWLQAQPQVAAGGVGMLGWSRGSEAALLTASRNRAIRAVVAVAPSSAVWQGLNFTSAAAPQPAWTLRGKPLASVVPNGAAYSPSASLLHMFQQSFTTLDARADAVLPVEQIRGGILLISGGSDNIWPSTRYADRIVARLQAMQFRGSFQHLDYPAAGHVVFVGDPSDPAARGLGAPNSMMGGSEAGNEAAWQDNWPRTLDFLRAQLKGEAR